MRTLDFEKPMTLWKSFKADFKNEHGDIKWEIGKWQKAEGEIKACENGFHASRRTIDAMRFVNCEILALVEVKGKHDDEDDKSAYEYMRIKQAWHWKKEDSVSLAIFAAELCIQNFEKIYPNDKRPRKAIEAAKDYLKCPCEKHQSAAWSAAWSAESAWSAVRSARSAVRSAESARSAVSAVRSAESARSAVRSAAESARSAVSAVRSAESARSADKVLDKCDKFIQERIKTLEEIK